MALLSKFFEELTSDFVGDIRQKRDQLYQMIADNVDSSLDDLGLDLPPDLAANSFNAGVNVAFLETFVSQPPLSHIGSALNELQQRVHDAVLQDTDRAIGTIFVLTAPAGTGKTFCINSILASAGLRNLRVVSCASSGLAASLLGHARTAHALLICR